MPYFAHTCLTDHSDINRISCVLKTTRAVLGCNPVESSWQFFHKDQHQSHMDCAITTCGARPTNSSAADHWFTAVSS